MVSVEMDQHRHESRALVAIVKRMIVADSVEKGRRVVDGIRVLQDARETSTLAADGRFEQGSAPNASRRDGIGG